MAESDLLDMKSRMTELDPRGATVATEERLKVLIGAQKASVLGECAAKITKQAEWVDQVLRQTNDKIDLVHDAVRQKEASNEQLIRDVSHQVDELSQRSERRAEATLAAIQRFQVKRIIDS